MEKKVKKCKELRSMKIPFGFVKIEDTNLVMVNIRFKNIDPKSLENISNIFKIRYYEYKDHYFIKGVIELKDLGRFSDLINLCKLEWESNDVADKLSKLRTKILNRK